VQPGSRLGPYEIVAAIGAGGMGEVHRARDTRLGRDVAIKVLPPHLAAAPEVRARFEREARTISQLNHPHICTLFDIGHQAGVDYLVMELLEGETLAHRLEKGPLPVPEVLALGTQIADALDRAHRAGVVHRDLKPGNVMLTKSGAKLMDFGLARAAGLAAAPGALTESPTVSRPLTKEGTIMLAHRIHDTGQQRLDPIFGAAIGVTIGGLMQLAVQVPSVLRRGFRYRLYLSFRDPEFRNVMALFLPVAIGLSGSRINVFVLGSI
jgi:serine/threonine protein kinase